MFLIIIVTTTSFAIRVVAIRVVVLSVIVAFTEIANKGAYLC